MGFVRERTATICCVLATLAVVLVVRTPEVRAASFYGTSYVHSPLQDSYQEADIQFDFKSSRAKGLLLMVAGARDYCIIQLKSGYIQVILELAGVDRSIKSPMKEKLNDQQWHRVHVVFTDRSMLLAIDDGFQREISFGGSSRDLRFEDGLFIGGTGSLETSYLEQAGRFFRGCIENVQFNRAAIVNGTHLAENVELFDVTLGCTSEFEAAPDAAISFVKDTSYVVFPRWQVGEFGSFACWVKTSAALGLLLYNGESDSSFVASEIVDGHVRVVLSHGAESIDFTSNRAVNDAVWHWVKITISQSGITISIDYEPELMIFDVPLSGPINLGGMMNLGGVVLKARAEAYQSNLNSITDLSTGGSFNGCIRDVEVNNEKQALGDSRVTHGIEIGCVYDFPCIQGDPCSPGEECIETGPGSMDFLCESDYDEDEEDFDAVTTGAPGTTQQQGGAFVATPLRLPEGGRKVINTDNIQLNVDLRSLQVRESQILFRIIRRPKHGTIENDVLRRDDNALEFTLLDLNGNKIFYVHDGSENHQDETMIAIELLGIDVLPPVFKGSPNVTIPIHVTPVNDPPSVIMAPNNVLKMIQNNRRPIRYSFLQGIDPDNATSELVFSIINQGQNVGQLEYVDIPGVKVSRFSQEDIDQERVVYSHIGPLTKSRIVYKLTDGLKETNLGSFRVDAMPLKLEVVNNSAARLNPRSMVPITSQNLYSRTNDPDGKLPITYTVTEHPTMGELQLKTELEGDFNWWNSATRFTQADVNEDRVRYFAARSTIRKSLKRDWVIMTASCQDVSVEDIEFKIEIVLTSIQMQRNTGLALDLRRQAVIVPANLSAVVEHPLEASPIIIYTVVRKPAKGHLLMPSVGQLIEGSNFTQIDIDVGLIGYQVDDQVHSAFNDSFLFQLSVSNAQSSILRFNISYTPDTDTLIVTNRGFSVREGGSSVITSNELYLIAGEITDFVYQVTRLPEHGELQLLDASESVVARRNISSFLNFDLASGTLQYQHDDSESRSDSFAIYAIATYVGTDGVRRNLNYTSTIDIMVDMINDHKPVPLINRDFQVVRNGKTPLTDKFLKYTDEDIDFNDNNIQFQRQRIPIGDLISTRRDNTSVYQFTQRDINEGSLVFKHQSNSLESRLVFFVFDTDRSRYTPGILNIVASDPFIRVDTNTGLKLTRGGSTVITNANLTAETNLGVKDKKITYLITTPTRNGVITIEGIPTSTFTQEDLAKGKMSYNHDNSSNMLDYFNFTVRAKDQDTEGWMRIRVFLEGHQREPEVERLKVLTLEEGTFAVLDKSRLKVSHSNHLPVELVFHITTSPMHGHLQLIKDLDETTNFGIDERILSFTQQDVNRNWVYYVQTDTGFESDKFTFEVSTGFISTTNQTFTIDIAPKIVPVFCKAITVLEGASKSISNDILHIAHSFYLNQPFDYYILQQPANGLVESSRGAGEALSKFSTQDVINEFIYYVHDGSDTTQDSFVVTANSTNGDKASIPCVIQISITPINDRAPELTSPNALTIYVGSTTTITTASLSASDPDTAAENLMYTLVPPSNGIVAVKSEPTIPIRNFTQAVLERGDVIFVHTGSRTGGFRFRVSDGLHFTTRELFTIVAKPLLIAVVNNTGIKVAPGILQPITSHNLKVMPTEESQTVIEQPITYTLTDGPNHGEIVKILDNREDGTSTFQVLREFTQADIDNGVIGYQLSEDTTASRDVFVFDVTLTLSQNLEGQEVEVEVVTADMIETTNLVTTKPMQQTTRTLSPDIIRNRGVEVREGASITITDDHLSAVNLLDDLSDEDIDQVILEYELLTLPSHGYLLIGQRNLTRESKFTQTDIDTIGIRYVHDHSDDREDDFTFTVRIKPKDENQDTSERENPYRAEFVITIDPVNDKKFVVETTSLHMRVVQGTDKIITPAELKTTDPDNLPSEITYQLYGTPSNGKLALTSDSSIAVTQFTQEQINNGDIVFVHDGGKRSGGFVFKITDGNSAHVQIKQFTIDIVPVSLSIFTEEIVLPQADKVVTISDMNLNVTTNGDREKVAYNITTFPRYGQIMVDQIPQLSFTQKDIDDDLVQYVQTVLSKSNDLFRFTMYDAYNVVKNLNTTINVRPLIYLEQLNATTGMNIPITTNYINASELAQKTNSNPSFKILIPPQRGLILNKTSRLAISQFNYSDLIASQVVYAADLLGLESNITLQDSFVFEYSALNAQPVEVPFSIEIGPRSADFTTLPTTPTQLRTRGRGNRPSWDNNNDTNVIDFPRGGDFDFFPSTDPSQSGNEVGANSDVKTKTVESPKLNTIVIIIPVVIIIVIIFIIVLIVLWKLNGKEKKNQARQSTYPEPDIGPYPGSQPVPVQVGMMPPVNIQSIRPDHRQPNGHIPTRVKSPMVPQVTVTALGRPPTPPPIFNPVNSLVSLSSNGTATMAYQYDSNCEQCDAEYAEAQCRTASPTLKKSQYWV